MTGNITRMKTTGFQVLEVRPVGAGVLSDGRSVRREKPARNRPLPCRPLTRTASISASPPVPGAVHAVVAENPGEIARLVLDFLGTMPAAPSPP